MSLLIVIKVFCTQHNYCLLVSSYHTTCAMFRPDKKKNGRKNVSRTETLFNTPVTRNFVLIQYTTYSIRQNNTVSHATSSPPLTETSRAFSSKICSHPPTGKITPCFFTSLHFNFPTSLRHAHLEPEEHNSRDEQAQPQHRGAVKADPEQLVVSAIDLGHVFQGLEHPLRRAVLPHVAPPPKAHLRANLAPGATRASGETDR